MLKSSFLPSKVEKLSINALTGRTKNDKARELIFC